MGSTMAMVCSLAGLAGIADLRVAAAQPAPAPLPAPTSTAAASEPAVAPAVDPRSDAAWRLYHDAFAALLHGEVAQARVLARALVRDYPDHPAAGLVRSTHLELAPGAAAAPTADARRGAPETASDGARAELALFQSLHGVALGIEGCIVLSCDSGEAYFGLALAGGAAGGLISANLRDLTPGERALLNSGTAWGAVNAGLLLIASHPDVRPAGLTLIAGQVGGLFTGATLFNLHPTAGQVAVANSGGAWAGVLTALTFAAIGSHGSDADRAITAMVAIDAGIATGAYLASRWPRVSRAQSLVIDAGGVVGAVGGGGIGVLISGQISDRSTPAIAAAGTVIGLGAAAYFTRDWNDDGASTDPVHAYLAPAMRGHGGIAGVGFSW